MQTVCTSCVALDVFYLALFCCCLKDHYKFRAMFDVMQNRSRKSPSAPGFVLARDKRGARRGRQGRRAAAQKIGHCSSPVASGGKAPSRWVMLEECPRREPLALFRIGAVALLQKIGLYHLSRKHKLRLENILSFLERNSSGAEMWRDNSIP